MARKKNAPLLKGRFVHRRTESAYLGVLLDAVSPEDWREVVSTTLAAAKAGDAGARAWLGHYLMGRPNVPAPAPLAIVVQQVSGSDPLVEALAQPHIDSEDLLLTLTNNGFQDDVKARVADELRVLEGRTVSSGDTDATTSAGRPSRDSRTS